MTANRNSKESDSQFASGRKLAEQRVGECGGNPWQECGAGSGTARKQAAWDGGQRGETEKVVASCGLPAPLSVGKMWLWGCGGLGSNVGGQGRTRCTREETR